jgi:hypothetical protein
VAEAGTATCRNELGVFAGKGEHMGVEFSMCNVQAAWAGILMLRPLTPTRHLRNY